MVNTRVFVPYTSSCSEVNIRGRFYPARAAHGVTARPRQVEILTRQPSPDSPKQRYPFAENVMDGSIQPFTHDIRVTVKDGPHTYQYQVFFKRHKLLKPSACFSRFFNNQAAVVRSDVVVLRVGKEAGFVSMRERDTILADAFVKKFARMTRLRRQHLPLTLDFEFEG